MALDTSERQRLFVAVYPDEAVRDSLHRLAIKLTHGSGARVVPQSSLHITMKFLGSVDGPTQTCLQQKLDQIRGWRFELQFERVVYRKRQQMLWAVLTAVPPELNQLFGALAQSASECGIPLNGHTFLPHVTLARKVRKVDLPLEFKIPETHIDEFVLVRSETRPEGSRYTKLKCWPLRAVTS